MFKLFCVVVFDMDGIFLDMENFYFIVMKQVVCEFGYEMIDVLYCFQVGVFNVQCCDIMLDVLGKDFFFDVYNI